MQLLQGFPVLIPDLIPENGKRELRDLQRIVAALDINDSSPETFSASLPFISGDATAGAENELQVAVMGKKDDVDLPVTIAESNFFHNIVKRIQNEEVPRKVFTELEKYLAENPENVWENSWVRFPLSVLSPFARQILEKDLLADKRELGGPKRRDAAKFLVIKNGLSFLRVPVSYLLKLSLADALGSAPTLHPLIKAVGERFMQHFSNDNTSPETSSFHPVVLRASSGWGRAVAKETALRFFLTQLLSQYANENFQLLSQGQRAVVYSAPHPPVHQEALNEIISDAFYRELFMSPCLSGWDRGEEKHQYMILCHQVLSRSQMHAVAKLKEAGIITNNLVTLPNISNTSLANNGTHISLGSRKLSRLLQEGSPDFGAAEEKFLGDLGIKIFEHFLPLFVGTYSASPYRLDFRDFHPEKVLGFLPHELDYTHLRMIWRRWKKKANLKIFGHPLTPFGPRWLDVPISKIFSLRGDFIPDFRLIDYPVCMMSTPQSPALDGFLGNDQRLKDDLADLGIYDSRMALYLFYRLRQFSHMGFTGFEGRHYSLFAGLQGDMGQAAGLQALITALSFRYILRGEITHAHIPNDPSLESERRQIFFGAAIGIPTFYVRRDTRNAFLNRILQRVERTRPSHRYPGFLRVYNLEYRRALIRILKEEAADLIEIMGLQEEIRSLEERIENPQASALGRITKGILDEAGVASPLKLPGQAFNRAAERYYRGTLRKKHMEEAFQFITEDFKKIDSHIFCSECVYKDAHRAVLGTMPAGEFLASIKAAVLDERASPRELRNLIHLTVLSIYLNLQEYEKETERIVSM